VPDSIHRPLTVFLCHASQDKPVVRELARRLFTEGWIDPWLDEKKLLPGHDWRLMIEEAVERSDVVIICLSSNSVNKEGHVQKELRYAREISFEKPEGTIFLIPLRLDNCETPRGLRFFQWADYFGESKDETYSALLEALQLRYEQKLNIEEELARKENEKQEREAAAKASRQKSEREATQRATRKRAKRIAAERAAQEKAKREAVEKTERERAEQERRDMLVREAAEKARKEREERKAAEKAEREKAKRERAARRTAQLAVLKEYLSTSLTSLRLAFTKVKPFLGKASIIGITLVLIVFGLWRAYQFSPLITTATPSLAPSLIATTTSSTPLVLFTKTLSPTTSPTKTSIPPTATFTSTPTRIVAKNTTPTNVPPVNPPIRSTWIQVVDGMTMVPVPVGEFTMGSDDGFDGEEPVHTVYLDGFWIDRTEITNSMYAKCVEDGACKPPSSVSSFKRDNYYGNPEFSNYPVIYVSWDDANTYCSWADRRLPTEAEWEKAARGENGRTYPWGEAGITCTLANFNTPNYLVPNLVRGCFGDTSPVDSHKNGKSPYGAYDMAGNVWEWVSSLYKAYPYDARDGREDMSSLDARVYRGGSWGWADTFNRSARRLQAGPEVTSHDIGFRCARDIAP
jgi:formylglycine-generating enzyme required for sulfatase activity